MVQYGNVHQITTSVCAHTITPTESTVATIYKCTYVALVVKGRKHLFEARLGVQDTYKILRTLTGIYAIIQSALESIVDYSPDMNTKHAVQ